MAAFTSSRLPSNSRHTMPIFSVTLACRILVTTLNFWPSFQISGSLMSLGGNISHKRLCVGELGCVSAVFLNALAIPNNFLSKWSRHLACPFFVFALLILGDTGWKPVPLFLAARNRRDDADFVTVFQRRFPVFQEADVFLVHINVHKTAHLALVIHEAFLDAGEARLQFDDRFADGGGVDFDQLLVVGQLAERCWDSDFFGHKLIYDLLMKNRSRFRRRIRGQILFQPDNQRRNRSEERRV